MQPDIRYARNDGVAIAYQLVGAAERDLILVPDFVSNCVYHWETPYYRELYERLARSFRLIVFDKRGTGLSDRGGAGWASLETRMDDMRAVLEGAGSERALVLGGAEGGQMAALFAATHPELTAGLDLFQFEARGGGADSPEWHQTQTQLGRWGTQGLADEWLSQICPTLLRSEADRIWFANHLRTGASPEIGYALNEAYYASDVSDILSTIREPTPRTRPRSFRAHASKASPARTIGGCFSRRRSWIGSRRFRRRSRSSRNPRACWQRF